MFLMAVLIGLTACNKETPTNLTDTSSVEFKIDYTNFNGGVRGLEEVPLCSDLSLDYAKFTLGGIDYKSDIFVINSTMYTQVIKLDIGTYNLTNFLLYNDNDTPNDEADDILVRAAPSPGSEYWDLMTNPLDVTVIVDAFVKKQVIVDVLCFEDLFYDQFGFTWFEMNEIKIERQCYFGDICTGKLNDFIGSMYEQQSQGLQMDMPAIFEIRVFKNGGTDPIRLFSNEDWLGEGQCLEVYWANDLDVEETFKFELWINLPSGPGFDYMFINSWEFLDGNGSETGDDGVVDFVLGACQIEDANYQFPYWMDLPPNQFTMSVGTTVGPSTHGTYLDVTLSGIPAGYDIVNDTYGVWCADHETSIAPGSSYPVTAVNSLADILPVDLTVTREQIEKLNYFFNELPELCVGQGNFSYSASGNYWQDIQQVIWDIVGDVPASTPLAVSMKSNVETYGAGYLPPPGGWAAILFWTGPQVQLLFVVVDP